MSSYLEAIAALGKGNLHPGGFSHTLKLLRNFIVSQEDIVLDIGCGTGRTACYLAKTYCAHVFGLDNSEKMIAKAKSRAAREGAEVHFLTGDVLDMPFRDEVADMILIESVLVFLPVQEALKECYRVLKKKGFLAAIELVVAETLPVFAKEHLTALCGLPQVPSFNEWLGHFDRAGFSRVSAKENRYPGFLDGIKEMLHFDPYQVVSQDIFTDRKLKTALKQYMRLVLQNREHLGFGTFILRKD